MSGNPTLPEPRKSTTKVACQLHKHGKPLSDGALIEIDVEVQHFQHEGVAEGLITVHVIPDVIVCADGGTYVLAAAVQAASTPYVYFHAAVVYAHNGPSPHGPSPRKEPKP